MPEVEAHDDFLDISSSRLIRRHLLCANYTKSPGQNRHRWAKQECESLDLSEPD